MISAEPDQLSPQTPANPIPTGSAQSAPLACISSLRSSSTSLNTMAYPLETPRHQRPPPISIHAADTSKGLATSPFSVLSMSPTRSPTSPSFSSRPRGGKRIKSPPPSQSAIPSKALQNDLEAFADQCRLWCVFNAVFLALMDFERSYLIGTITKTRRRVA